MQFCDGGQYESHVQTVRSKYPKTVTDVLGVPNWYDDMYRIYLVLLPATERALLLTAGSNGIQLPVQNLIEVTTSKNFVFLFTRFKEHHIHGDAILLLDNHNYSSQENFRVTDEDSCV